MALKMKSDAQTVFFEQFLGPQHPGTKLVKSMVAAGAEFEVSLYSIKGKFQGKFWEVKLSAGTSALMKHTVDDGLEKINLEYVMTFISTMADAIGTAVISKQATKAVEAMPEMVAETVTETVSPLEIKPKTVLPLYKVHLKKVGPNKIAAIKLVRELTYLGLKDSKDLVDSAEILPNGAEVIDALTLKDAEEVVQAFGDIQALAEFQKYTTTLVKEEALNLYGVLLGAVGENNKPYLVKLIRKLMNLPLSKALEVVNKVEAGEPQMIEKAVPYTIALKIVAEVNACGGEASVVGPKGVFSAEYDMGNPVPKPLEGKELKPEYKEAPAPVNKVIPLRQAKALLQKVEGTSAGAVYRCVAVSENLKLATRIYTTGQVSIRAEWDKLTPALKQALIENKFDIKGQYASIHLTATPGLPPAKMIGAFLLGMGINWQQVATKPSDLLVEN